MDNNLLEQLSDRSKNIFGFDKNSLTKNYSKFYVSNKRENEKLYFKIDFSFSVSEDYKERINFEMNVSISYLFFVKDNKCFTVPGKKNEWEITTYPDRKSCGLKNSIMIEENYRSYGIGSFLLNTILSIANSYIPDYSLSAGLGIGDEREDNKERRNSLYRNIGFEFVQSKVSDGERTVDEDGIYIDKLSNLNLNREFEYIEEIEPLKLSNMICEMSNRIDELEKENEILSRSNINYETENKKLLKSLGKWQAPVIIIGLIVVISAAISLRFIFG